MRCVVDRGRYQLKRRPPEQRLTFAQKVSRLATRMKDREWRRYGALLFLGKFIGMAVVLAVMFGAPYLMSMTSSVGSALVGARTAYAQTAAAPTSMPEMSAATAPAAAVNPATTQPVM